MNVCLYCTCMGQLTKILPEDALRKALGPGITLGAADCLCAGQPDEKTTALAQGARHLVVAACPAGARGNKALANLSAPGNTSSSTFTGSTSTGAYSIALADIREGCIWPGAKRPVGELAEQAADLVRMKFAASGMAVPQGRKAEPARNGVLVVGAGPAGLAAASVLAGLGVPATLADRRPTSGGMLNQLGRLFPALDTPDGLLSALPQDGAETLTGTSVTALRRKNAGYAATLRNGQGEQEAFFDAVILATGGQPVLPGKRFRHGELRGVISQMELETLLGAVEKGTKDGTELPEAAVFLQCVNAREDSAPYCSAVCCPTAVKNALRLKALRPDATISILYRQMVMPGIALEELYRKARKEGVRFLHIEDDAAPRVEGEDRVEALVVPASSDRPEERIAARLLVCSTPVRPAPSTEALAAGLGLRLDAMRFVRGHEPSHPLETDLDGVFVCGSARWPAYVSQAVEQGRAAALLAVRYLTERRAAMEEIPEEGFPAEIRPELCSGCARCVEACPHKACRPADTGNVCMVEPELCRRCGVCAAVCPCGAARLPGASPSGAEIFAALGPDVCRRAEAESERRRS